MTGDAQGAARTRAPHAAVRPGDRWKMFSEGARRVWFARSAGWRAIAPAWPAALGAIAAIALLILTGQGRQALDVTVDLGGDAFPRYAALWGALVLFSLGIAASAMFVMAAPRDDHRVVGVSTPPDPVHTSVNLRTRTAFVLGAAAPFALSLHLAAPFAPDGDPVWAPRWLIALAWALLMFGVCWLLARAATNVQRSMREAYRNCARPNDESGRAKTARYFRIACIAAAYHGADLLRGLSRAPHRHGLAVLAALAAFALTSDAARGANVEGGPSSSELARLGIVLATGAFALGFLGMRNRAMRVVEGRDMQHLIIDRMFQTSFRGLSFLVVAGLLAVLWLPAFGYGVHQAIGPVALALAGVSIVVSFLTWLVRSAVESQAQAQVNYRPPLLLAPFHYAGEAVEAVQRYLTPLRIFGVGLTLLALDWIVLPLFEWLRGGMPAMIFAIAAIPATGIGVWRLLRWWRTSFGAARRTPMRLASIVVLAPFLLATLGENHHAATMRRLGAPPEDVERAAEAWLANAARRAARNGGANAPIPAVIVLAEGGGLRAASHAGQLLAAIEVEEARNPKRTPFFDRVFAISGVSGGALGAAAYLQARHDRSETGGAERLRAQVYKAVSGDYLSPLLGGMFASDMLTLIIPVELPARILRIADPHGAWPDWIGDELGDRGLWDRADFFERAWERAWSTGGRAMSLERAVGRAASGAPAPIVLFGAFSAQSGAMAAASNVVSGQPRDGASAASLQTLQSLLAPDRTFPLSTAAHVSARFPGANPPALIETYDATHEAWLRRRYVDGGYFDNSGAAAAGFALQALYTAAEKLDIPDDRLRILVLRIYVRDGEAEAERRRREGARGLLDEFVTEAGTPAGAVMRARDTSGDLPLLGFCRLVARDPRLSQPCAALPGRIGADSAMHWVDAELHIGETDTIPLGWMLSKRAHARIESQARKEARAFLERLDAALNANALQLAEEAEIQRR